MESPPQPSELLTASLCEMAMQQYKMQTGNLCYTYSGNVFTANVACSIESSAIHDYEFGELFWIR